MKQSLQSDFKAVDTYIGLGSNLEYPVNQVRKAIEELSQMRESKRIVVSRLYRSPPMGSADQPDYINAVMWVRTLLDPFELLDELLNIEHTHGRIRHGGRWEPRTLDLDLLLYEDRQINDLRLTVPHPGIQHRGFVLYPLNEINPTLHIPGRGLISHLLARCPCEDLSPID
jgi:2-amino-4-hydroxy-6-hydroxymethyldihydropteridine diphosphokinase